MSLVRVLAVAAVGTALLSRAPLSTTASQTFSVQVLPINMIAIAPGAPSLTINSASAGSSPTSVTASGYSWAVTTNQSGWTVSGSIATAMPTGVTLSASMAAPAGGVSTGLQPLGTSAVALVTGVTKVSQSGMAITYQLDATVAAGVVSSATRLVTYTMTGGV